MAGIVGVVGNLLKTQQLGGGWNKWGQVKSVSKYNSYGCFSQAVLTVNKAENTFFSCLPQIFHLIYQMCG